VSIVLFHKDILQNEQPAGLMESWSRPSGSTSSPSSPLAGEAFSEFVDSVLSTALFAVF